MKLPRYQLDRAAWENAQDDETLAEFYQEQSEGAASDHLAQFEDAS